MSKSNYLENQFLDFEYGIGAYTPPVTHYIALYTSAPTDAGGGTEVTGGGYSRKAVTNNSTNWPAAVNGVKSNGVDFDWAVATGLWGTVEAWAIWDDPTAGNMKHHGLLTVPKLVDSGDQFSFPAGQLEIEEG